MKKIRIGIIDFCNSYPLFYAVKERIIPIDAELICGTPLQINECLASGDVDIALVSSAFFLHHKSNLSLLTNFGIAATGPVLSVRLFFDADHGFAHCSKVYLPALSATSVLLFKTLCTHVWKISPTYEFYSSTPPSIENHTIPFVSIGDQCLSLFENSSLSSLDLSEEWHLATKKSMTFALIATRKESAARSPEAIAAANEMIKTSYQWAQTHREAIITAAVFRTQCSRVLIEDYFSKLEHRLEERHLKDLEYFAYLIDQVEGALHYDKNWSS